MSDERPISEHTARAAPTPARDAGLADPAHRDRLHGLAHDVNNIASVILSCADAVLGALDAAPSGARPAHGIAADVREIRRAAQRAATLTRDVMAPAREEAPPAIDLAAAVRKARGMLRALAGPRVELRLELEAQMPPARIETGELERALADLATNARHAMPRGGTLTIEAGVVRVAGADAPPGADDGRCARLTVRDSGNGMAGEVLERALEPRYTTREAAGGSGLGLPAVDAIVRARGGALRLESQPGAGTAVHLLLPLAAPRRAAPPAARDDGAQRPSARHDDSNAPPPRARRDDGGDTRPSARHGETVLVVDDEAALRAFTAHVLREYGYEVLEASSGRAALHELERHASEIDLLLSDVAMPEQTGLDLAGRVRGPEVLLMSGYPASGDPAAPVCSVPMLRKPFDAATLLQRVRAALDARGDAAD